jgi:DNA-binding MarR family transcriptional regulator
MSFTERKPRALSLLRAVMSSRWKDLGKSEKCVLLVLLIRAGNKLQSWPSIREIRDGCGLEAHSIHAALRSLEDNRQIVVWRKEGTRNRYGVSIWTDPDRTHEENYTG